MRVKAWHVLVSLIFAAVCCSCCCSAGSSSTQWTGLEQDTRAAATVSTTSTAPQTFCKRQQRITALAVTTNTTCNSCDASTLLGRFADLLREVPGLIQRSTAVKLGSCRAAAAQGAAASSYDFILQTDVCSGSLADVLMRGRPLSCSSLQWRGKAGTRRLCAQLADGSNVLAANNLAYLPGPIAGEQFRLYRPR
jgi:hypothetical protein